MVLIDAGDNMLGTWEEEVSTSTSGLATGSRCGEGGLCPAQIQPIDDSVPSLSWCVVM